MRFAVAICLSVIAVATTTIGKAAPASDNTPSIEDHIRLFLNLPIGISQRDFRLIVPAAWEARPSMYSMKQNQNPRGEINTGWFRYEFQARGDSNLQTNFTFWNSKLAASSIDDTAFDTPLSDAMLAASAEVATALQQKYGNPASQKIDSSRRVMEWHMDGITVVLSTFRKDPNNASSVGSIGLDIQDDSAHAAKSQWSRRLPDLPAATGPLSLFSCKRQVGTGAWIQFDVLVDTRKLSKDGVESVRKTKIGEFQKAGWGCEGETAMDASLELSLSDLERTRRHTLNTYLIFTDQEGLTNVIQLSDAGVENEDKVCNIFRSTITGGAPDAACVSGTTVLFRAK